MTCCAAPADVRTYLEKTGSGSDSLQHERLLANSTELTPNTYKTEFIVPELHCAGCIGAIERGLAGVSPVEQVRANLSLKSVSVIWNSKHGSIVEVSKKLDALGFEHHLSDSQSESKAIDEKGRALLLSLAVAGFSAANIMLLSVSVWSGADSETAQLFHLISGLIAIPSVMFAGRPFFGSALKAISARRLNMDVPISLAVLLALGMSIFESVTGGEEAYFDASITLLFFLLIGRYLDHLMRHKARGAVERLSSLVAKSGVVVQPDGELTYVELKDIRPGMQLRVFAGERFPVNGTIISGTSDLDRSHVTGESDSVFAKPGSEIEAGTLNLTAPVDFEATTSAQTSFLAEMRNMMEAAENGRGEYTRIADRMAQIYAPAVHLLALITFIVWMVISGGDWHSSIYTAIAVLIVTCPCALGLAVPVAHVIGANKLLQNGILMRDGTALERLADITAVKFDKTGTLTKGSPIVTRTLGDIKQSPGLIKSLSSASNHPVAKAIETFLAPTKRCEITNVVEIPGHGIEAIYNGRSVRLGKPDWVAEIAADTNGASTMTASFAIAGATPVHFDVEDELRADAATCVRTLQSRDLKLEILSGDNPEKVEHIADLTGIQYFHASLTPAQKITLVQDSQEKGENVLMVGDGINDAPALAAGHVSMVPASASDVGRHAADFVFTRQTLSAIPFACQIAKFTDRIVRQNFGLAIAYNCIAVPLAMGGYVTPLIAAIAMSASSIVVISNSFRINFATETPGATTIKTRAFSKTKEALA